ncbi:MAG: hypothetical protein IJW94_05635 [Oscillospiraceae bacterium]|nr:hypothetical protein [Oscillospiraceae bacterium]
MTGFTSTMKQHSSCCAGAAVSSPAHIIDLVDAALVAVSILLCERLLALL